MFVFRVLVLFCILLVFCVSSVFAHGDGEQVEGVQVSIAQEPLSPFVGETVKIILSAEDEDGSALQDFGGDVEIYFVNSENFQGGEAQERRDLVYESHVDTDFGGNTSIEYVFEKEGVYEVVFLWNDGEEDATHVVYPREPSSFFTHEELGKRIWLFVGVAFAGFVTGSLSTFVLLTLTLRRKR